MASGYGVSSRAKLTLVMAVTFESVSPTSSLVSIGTFEFSTMTTFEPGQQPEAQEPRQTGQGRVGA